MLRELTLGLTIAIFVLEPPRQAQAAEQCRTTLDCAQKAVEAAAQSSAAVLALQARVDGLEKQLSSFKTSIGPGRLLGSLVVRGSRIASSSPGVAFDSGTGVVTFPNPGKLKAVPVMSYISSNSSYATETVFAKSVASDTEVTIWQGAQDTSGRAHAPVDFTLVIVGF